MDELYMYTRALSQIEISKISQICDFRRVVLLIGFNHIQGNRVFDQSGLSNFAEISNGTELTEGLCGQGINFTSNGHLTLNGDEFRQKPSNAITIAVWLRLNTNR